ncbi:MAG: nucleotidyltransferase family protein [Bacteroidota bacterium]
MTVCLLLAAGSSSRMNTGRHHRPFQQTGEQETGLTCGAHREATPKMLLPFNGKTFLQHAVDEIKNSDADGLVVVTGCYHSLLKDILLPQQIDLIKNKNWEEGMGSSIQKGIQYITRQYPEADNIIITVCDQPYLSSALLNQLQNAAKKTGKGIIASAYNDTIGTPVLFAKKYFEHLAILSGQHGAKKIIQNFNEDVETVSFPLGIFDIDTPQDYDRLNTAS